MVVAIMDKERLVEKIIHLRRKLSMLNPFYSAHDKVEKELMEAVEEYKKIERIQCGGEMKQNPPQLKVTKREINIHEYSIQ